MLQRWSGTSDAMIGEAVAKTCLLGPDPVEDVAVLRRLAELHRPGPIAPWLAPWFQQTRALAAYRSGDSAGAIEILNSPQARFPYAGRGRCSAADFYLAIALYHTGHLQEAQDALRRGVQRSETIMLKPGEGSIGPDPATWLICQIARREAEALVHGAGYETPAGHSGEAGDQ